MHVAPRLASPCSRLLVQLAHQPGSASHFLLPAHLAGFMKMTLPTAWTVATLAQGALEFPLAYRYNRQWRSMQLNLQHGADYLLKAHLNASDYVPHNVLAVQVGRAQSWRGQLLLLLCCCCCCCCCASGKGCCAACALPPGHAAARALSMLPPLPAHRHPPLPPRMAAGGQLERGARLLGQARGCERSAHQQARLRGRCQQAGGGRGRADGCGDGRRVSGAGGQRRRRGRLHGAAAEARQVALLLCQAGGEPKGSRCRPCAACMHAASLGCCCAPPPAHGSRPSTHQSGWR